MDPELVIEKLRILDSIEIIFRADLDDFGVVAVELWEVISQLFPEELEWVGSFHLESEVDVEIWSGDFHELFDAVKTIKTEVSLHELRVNERQRIAVPEKSSEDGQIGVLPVYDVVKDWVSW